MTKGKSASEDAGRSGTSLHNLVRKIASSYRDATPDAEANRLQTGLDLLQRRYADHLGKELVDQLNSLIRSERHYVIGAVYAKLMSGKRRKTLSAYFTPPHISAHILRQLAELGHDYKTGTVIDPACGGAAFLVPMAERMAVEAAIAPESDGAALAILDRIVGLEIEPGLATLSEALIADAIGLETGKTFRKIVRRGNALKHKFARGEGFDAVVANPPYGRVFRAKRETIKQWSDVITDGHVNTYALFVALSVKMAKIGGIIALVIPTSFIGGPYFANLRKFMRARTDIIQIEIIKDRSEAFIDVVQDACILYLRRRKAVRRAQIEAPKVFAIGDDGARKSLGILSLAPDLDGVWALPAGGANTQLPQFFDRRFSNLADYGYLIKSGYFVWNRNHDRLADRLLPESGEVPLVWANNIKSGQVVKIASRNPVLGPSTKSFVKFDGESDVVIRGPSIVIQRTTNKNQSRRLIVGLVSGDVAVQYGGYITENHTIVIIAEPLSGQKVPLSVLAALLSSEAVDEIYRQVSGTASVSTRLLRRLPLPKPDILLQHMQKNEDFDAAVRAAYEQTLAAKA